MIIEESEATPKIKVLIRKRPLSKRELQKADMDIIDIRDPQSIIVRENKTKVDLTKYMEEHNFVFDGAFDQYATNQKVTSFFIYISLKIQISIRFITMPFDHW